MAECEQNSYFTVFYMHICANERYTYKTNNYDILGYCKLKKNNNNNFKNFMRINNIKISGDFWNQGSYGEIIAVEKNQKLEIAVTIWT